MLNIKKHGKGMTNDQWQWTIEQRFPRGRIEGGDRSNGTLRH